jgi:hypothetical protein
MCSWNVNLPTLLIQLLSHHERIRVTQYINFVFMQYYLSFWHRSFTFNSNKSPTWCKSFPVYYPDFFYSSICFGRFPAHHQELNDCSGSFWFYIRFVVTVMLCSWSGLLWTHSPCFPQPVSDLVSIVQVFVSENHIILFSSWQNVLIQASMFCK